MINIHFFWYERAAPSYPCVSTIFEINSFLWRGFCTEVGINRNKGVLAVSLKFYYNINIKLVNCGAKYC